MSEREDQPVDAHLPVVDAESSPDYSRGEYEAMLHRAKRLRMTANGILVVVGGLLLFGGYVFFQAANITTRDYNAVLENARLREERLNVTIARLETERAMLKDDVTRLRMELEALKAIFTPTPTPSLKIPGPTSTP